MNNKGILGSKKNTPHVFIFLESTFSPNMITFFMSLRLPSTNLGGLKDKFPCDRKNCFYGSLEKRSKVKKFKIYLTSLQKTYIKRSFEIFKICRNVAPFFIQSVLMEINNLGGFFRLHNCKDKINVRFKQRNTEQLWFDIDFILFSRFLDQYLLQKWMYLA